MDTNHFQIFLISEVCNIFSLDNIAGKFKIMLLNLIILIPRRSK